MSDQHIAAIAGELHLPPDSVRAAAALLDEGATVPFIARYRKEATGSLDETAIIAVRDRLAQLRALDKRRETILKSLSEQDQLSPELEAAILEAETLSILEDLYLPYRPKRRTRATAAREKGLEPLARTLFAQHPDTDPVLEAAAYVQPDLQVASAEEALAGARDIIAEWANENAEVRAALRDLFTRKGVFQCRVVSGKETEGIQFKDYFEWQEPLASAPSHRVLAMLRGEKKGFLTVHLAPPPEAAIAVVEARFLKTDSRASEQVRLAVQDGYRRLLAPSLETELKQWAKHRADEDAIGVFADNVRHLLMAPPLGTKRVLAVDPGFRTGCKVVVLDPQGKLLHRENIFPHTGEQAAAKAAQRMKALLSEFDIEAVAVGNGTAGRETEAFIRGLGVGDSTLLVLVDESGASVYSASATAREEFPEEDVTVRGAVSIGRRLMDPLAELVKIDPKSIGVGQYQHDVDQGRLKAGLEDVVTSCVNAVGVEVNTASAQLLAYVSGLGPKLAQNIVAYRDEHGPFRSRSRLRKVPRLGPRAFEQSAGFLRIRDGDRPLDASAVHPDAYPVVEAMATDLGVSVGDLMRDDALRARIDITRYLSPEVGLPTLTDIMDELAKPGRDPRQSFETFSFASGVERVEDLEPGMSLPGIITNVTAFGAFVDIGVHRDGLVHVSELADRFVKDPREVVRVHQRVTVTVLEVDRERNRIALSMKRQPGKPVSEEAAATGTAAGRTSPKPKPSPGRERRSAGPRRPEKPKHTKRTERPEQGKARGRDKKGAFHNPFADALKDL